MPAQAPCPHTHAPFPVHSMAADSAATANHTRVPHCLALIDATKPTISTLFHEPCFSREKWGNLRTKKNKQHPLKMGYCANCIKKKKNQKGSSVSQATTVGGGLPPSILGMGRRHPWRMALPTLVDFVLTVTLSMHHRDLTPILAPTQHPCMQSPPATHSHPQHGTSAHLIKLCSGNIPLRVLQTLVRESALPECEFPTLALYQE